MVGCASDQTGAKINYGKTKGLWIGKWKNRTDDPFFELYTDSTKRIKWTNKNVNYLGIYVGNDNPAQKQADKKQQDPIFGEGDEMMQMTSSGESDSNLPVEIRSVRQEK